MSHMSAIGYFWLAKHSWKPGKQMLLSIKQGSEQAWDLECLYISIQKWSLGSFSGPVIILAAFLVLLFGFFLICSIMPMEQRNKNQWACIQGAWEKDGEKSPRQEHHCCVLWAIPGNLVTLRCIQWTVFSWLKHNHLKSPGWSLLCKNEKSSHFMTLYPDRILYSLYFVLCMSSSKDWTGLFCDWHVKKRTWKQCTVQLSVWTAQKPWKRTKALLSSYKCVAVNLDLVPRNQS